MKRRASLIGRTVRPNGPVEAHRFFHSDLAPLVLGLTLRMGRKPVPYLLAVALAANMGSTATITGTPQNIMIGSFSRIPSTTIPPRTTPRGGAIRRQAIRQPHPISRYPTAALEHEFDVRIISVQANRQHGRRHAYLSRDKRHPAMLAGIRP
jgi:hypothetical protein